MRNARLWQIYRFNFCSNQKIVTENVSTSGRLPIVWNSIAPISILEYVSG